MLGPGALREYAAALYKGSDPLRTVDLPAPIVVESQDEDDVRISLHMPFLESEKFDVYSRGSEVIVRYGNFKRSLMLPYTLLGRDVREAKYKDRRLVISFGRRVRASSGAGAPEDDGAEDETGGGGKVGQEIGL